MAPISSILVALQREFAMKDLGSLHYFLGIEVRSHSSGLLLTQTEHIYDIFTRGSMLDCKPMSSPISLVAHLSLTDGDHFNDPFLYCCVVGSLQYLTLTQPNIAYVVQCVCQFMHQPSMVHWSIVRIILRYLKDY